MVKLLLEQGADVKGPSTGMAVHITDDRDRYHDRQLAYP
jgi:hypothetical protein